MPQEFIPHSDKQERALFSEKKILTLLTGIQYGKSSVGAWRMKMKMHQYINKADNFLICAPNYKIMQQASLPAFLKIMEGCGDYNKVDAVFRMHGGGNCYMRTATEPDSVVGITNVRHIWGDEAGKFSRYFHENIIARSGFKDCGIDYTSSPYAMNWLYKDFVKPKVRDPGSRPDVDLIQAATWENPFFPKSAIDHAKANMDPRRFNAMYGGHWEKMAGLVYDCFDEDENQVDKFAMPTGTKYYGGIDWGYTEPFVLKIRAVTPGGTQYGISEVYRTGMTIPDIIRLVKQKDEIYGLTRIWCDPSQPAHIEELNRNGIAASPANNDIRLGIDKHYELLKTRKLKYFRGENPMTIHEMEMYHYPDVDELGPDDKAKELLPVQQADHCCFAAGTMVLTESGETPIEEIRPGDLVWTPVGLRPVSMSGETGYRPVFRYIFSNNSELVCTPEHPVYQAFRGFCPLDFSTKNAIVSTWNSTGKNTIGMVNILCRIVVALMAARGCMSQFGSIITAQFQKTTTYITKTITDAITTFQILRPLTESNTSNITETILPNQPSENARLTLIESGHSQKSGTQAKPDTSGIKNTQRYHWAKHFGIMYARIAQSLLGQTAPAPYSVRQTARLILDAIAVLTTLRCVASSVANTLLRTNISRPERAVLVARRVYKNSQSLVKVFNITVPDAGCFYANGILVSNCDAERYLTFGLGNTAIKNRATVPSEKRKVNHHAETERLKRRVPKNHHTENWD